MALIFGDSFAHYAYADLLKKWTTTTLNAGYSGPQYALAPAPSCIIFGANQASLYLDKTLPGGAIESFVAGTYFQTGNTGAASIIMAFMDGATEHLSVRYTATGLITVTRNATVLATSASALSTATWYHIEVKATIGDAGDAPSGQYQVKVNGTDWIADSGAGQDTRNGGNKSISNVRLYSRGSADANPTNHRFQHYYLLSQTGAPSDFLGPCRFEILLPMGVGTTAEWTGNYADNWRNVADVLGDSDSTFNQSATAGQTDQFAMSNVPAGTVHAIQHVIMARKDAGAARTMRPLTRIGGTDYAGTTVSLAATYGFILEPVSVSPATAAAWDDAEVNAAEFGYELVS